MLKISSSWAAIVASNLAMASAILALVVGLISKGKISAGPIFGAEPPISNN